MSLHIDTNKNITLANGDIFQCSKIDRVGVELEGLFFDSDMLDSSLGRFEEDGSVQGFSQRGQCGEFVSKAIQPCEVENFITKCHPSGSLGRSNRSCGAHTHISLLSNGDYSTLMTQEFYDHFLTKWNQFGARNEINEDSHFYERVRGKQHCYAGFKPQQHKMVYHYDNDRYQHINFCYNVQKHGQAARKTVEFRIPPCFQSKTLQVKATLEILKIVQEYLEDNPIPRPITLRLSI